MSFLHSTILGSGRSTAEGLLDQNGPKWSRLVTRAAICRSLRAPDIAKSLKKLLWGFCRRSKYTRESPKTPKKVRKSVFLDFPGIFWDFSADPPKRPFLRLFCDFGPRGPRDSCKWRGGSQVKTNSLIKTTIFNLDLKFREANMIHFGSFWPEEAYFSGVSTRRPLTPILLQ